MPASPDEGLLRVRRHPERGSQERATVEAILDAGLVCHLGYLHDGRPVVVPTLYGRDEDVVVLHGSAASRAMRAGVDRLPVCVTVTLLDGLVLARSAFAHSVNYRSVVIHGEAERVDDPDDAVAALRTLTEHVAPGRWAEVRWPTPQELRATTVLRLSLDHAVAKVRTGDVADEESDLSLPVWAGVLPLATTTGPPLPAAGLDPELPLPPSVAAYATQVPGVPAASRHGSRP